jgi:hypothetical protein
MKVTLTFDVPAYDAEEAVGVLACILDEDFDPWLACYEVTNDDGTTVFLDGNGDPR